MFNAVAGQDAFPALAPVDADAFTAFVACIGFDLSEQGEPTLTLRSATGHQNANLALAGLDELGSSCRLDVVADRQPQKLIASQHLIFDIGELTQAGMVDRGLDKQPCLRPEQMNIARRDADEINR